MTKIFISGISPQTDEIELAKLFLVYGEINTIEIVRDKRTKQPKGFGFVELHNDQAALEAVENLDGAALGEGKLLVKVADDKPKPVNQSVPAESTNYVKVKRPVPGEKRKRPRLNK